MAYAHSRNDRGQRHDLVAHLHGTAELAASFAGAFGAGEAGRWLGIWHDVGKFHGGFQEYLLACETSPSARGHGPDHKAAGAQLGVKHLGLGGLLVQGHHGGLRTPESFQEWLAERSKDPAVGEALRLAGEALGKLEPEGRIPLPAEAQGDPLAADLLFRLLFSALVDADFLDTERHFRSDLAARRARIETSPRSPSTGLPSPGALAPTATDAARTASQSSPPG